MGLGQYDNLGEYCDPHTASSVFLILLLVFIISPIFLSMEDISQKRMRKVVGHRSDCIPKESELVFYFPLASAVQG